ncbi:Extradiol ring-cleavage dioxygenase, class III enzyme, subunit B [Athelia psychrophila]|uniref:Extradiol ring-cleavage dioxygenase, class III enzyme, subunit B n=1 Tax=Athelia psychrophila TaxID=1759441 RepID=A0A167TBD1_9AGAM|nr:Extradiol ring-cleavage dioxygenase, class III enzyme, subunit B [Fibularhizoctonia sp. CBS 109695]
MSGSPPLPKTRAEWQAALAALPATPHDIPAFFFAHGSPMLAFPEDNSTNGPAGVRDAMGPRGPLATFLRDFGPTLIRKYQPKGIVVFSAHWETAGERLVTDYGDENPLLMDYFGFQKELYELKFKSRGETALSERIVAAYKEAGLKARTTGKLESRGQDGRGFAGPGLDHGVFVPFRLMFGHEFLDIPIVQVSIDASMSPEANWAAGKAVAPLRQEGYLILAGGLTVHNLRDFPSFAEATAAPVYKEWNQAILDALVVPGAAARKEALVGLTRHRGFRAAQPREDHFVPLYVAAGAGAGGGDGGDGGVRVLGALYGAQTVAFGLPEE